MDELFRICNEIMHRKLLHLSNKERPFFKKSAGNSRSLLITGPRGVGKTTYLLNLIKDKSILYISADLPQLQHVSLFDFARNAFLAGYDGLAIDEVHYAKDWSIHVKAIYDSYPDKIIYITDSSSAILRSGYADLSRRFVQYTIPFLSFREFIYFETGILFHEFSPFDNTSQYELEIHKQIPLMKLFREYIHGGIRPIYLEGDYENRIMNVIEKTIYTDIPYFLPSIVDNNFRLLNAIMAYLAKSKIPTLAIRSLCTEWGIGAEKLYKLLSVMENVGLIRVIRKKNDFKGNSIGAKIFLNDPSMYTILSGITGNIREAYLSGALAASGYEIYASPDETAGDLVANDLLIECGGKSKNIKQADFVFRDDIEYSDKNSKALWTAGFGY